MSKEYSELKLKCYLCQKKNHIALDCQKFKLISGNLRPKHHSARVADRPSDDDEQQPTQYYRDDLVVPRSSFELAQLFSKHASEKPLLRESTKRT